MTACADKILVLGIDGMDPRLSKYYMDQGLMPNLKKLVEAGSAREGLEFLGQMPTITPPMWTTLSTGTYPMTHGITDFWHQDPNKLGVLNYGLDSSKCKAEQMWNVFAEAGKKTFVLHWPGSSWPPTSPSENLYVIDGTNPEGICMGTGQVFGEYFAIASEKEEKITWRGKDHETQMMCVVDDVQVEEKTADDGRADNKVYSVATSPNIEMVKLGDYSKLDPMTHLSFEYSVSTIKPADKWNFGIPADAKEIAILFSEGLVRYNALITKNEAGVYDTVTIYKNKRTEAPVVSMKLGEFVEGVIVDAIKNDEPKKACCNMRLMDLAEDGSDLRIWISAGIDTTDDSVFSPKSLHAEIVENVGYPMPVSNTGSSDARLMFECMAENWTRSMRWWADTILYMIENKGVEVVFSQIHNDDAEKHNFYPSMCKGHNKALKDEDYEKMMLLISQQNDYYIGRFLHLLDEGWTIFLVSDHGLIVSEMGQSPYVSGIWADASFMRDWGYTEVKYDENGNPLEELDLTKTKAVHHRSNSIYINVKGRWEHGIVEPEDKEALEDEIIAKLYSLRDEKGRNVVSLALKNKDAVLLGLTGPECGDIVVMNNQQNLYDHCDGLSTAIGEKHTSVAPIFVAAGKGIKKGYTCPRVIRQVDLVPTIALMAGVRVPEQCEGGPIYQIIEN